MLLEFAFLLNLQVLNENSWMKSLVFIGMLSVGFGLKNWTFSPNLHVKYNIYLFFPRTACAPTLEGPCPTRKIEVVFSVLHTRGAWRHTVGMWLQLPMCFCHFLFVFSSTFFLRIRFGAEFHQLVMSSEVSRIFIRIFHLFTRCLSLLNYMIFR